MKSKVESRKSEVTPGFSGFLANYFRHPPSAIHLGSAAMLAVAMTCSTAGAQPYPSRPVRVVVPFAPGGAVDLVARAVAPRLSDALGQGVVVDNRGGAGGTLGTDIVAKARPDGHTLLVASMGVAVNAVLYPKLPYDTLKDLAPITTLGEQPNIVVVHPSVAAKSLGDLLALARAKPGQVTYGSGGSAAIRISPPSCSRRPRRSICSTFHTRAWGRRSPSWWAGRCSSSCPTSQRRCRT